MDNGESSKNLHRVMSLYFCLKKDQSGSSVNAVWGTKRVVGDIANRGLLGHTDLILAMLG